MKITPKNTIKSAQLKSDPIESEFSKSKARHKTPINFSKKSKGERKN
jgi:hypothetical protein